MSTTSTRTTSIVFTGDASGTQTLTAAANAASPGETEPLALAPGDNVIAIPTGGTTPTCVSILKPAGSTALLKLKGTGTDAGIALHKTDPDSISLDPSQASITINASIACNVRLIWS